MLGTGVDPGGGGVPTPLKLEQIRFVGVKS